MTIDEYKKWKLTRNGDAARWKREDCVAADALVKEETLHNLSTKLKKTDPIVAHYVMLMARTTFGTSETDAFLLRFRAYPDWM